MQKIRKNWWALELLRYWVANRQRNWQTQIHRTLLLVRVSNKERKRGCPRRKGKNYFEIAVNLLYMFSYINIMYVFIRIFAGNHIYIFVCTYAFSFFNDYICVPLCISLWRQWRPAISIITIFAKLLQIIFLGYVTSFLVFQSVCLSVCIFFQGGGGWGWEHELGPLVKYPLLNTGVNKNWIY